MITFSDLIKLLVTSQMMRDLKHKENYIFSRYGTMNWKWYIHWTNNVK